MTAASTAVSRGQASALVTRQRVLGVFYILLAGVTLLVFANVPAGKTSSFGLTLGLHPAIPLPDLVLPTGATAYVIAALVAFLGAYEIYRGASSRWTIVLGIVAVAFSFGFLTWAAAGNTVSLVGILQGALQLSVPIAFGAMSGILCERAGVVNVAIEGMLLGGAFVAAVTASVTGNEWVGLVSAVVVGALLAVLLAILAIRYLVDQIIAGFVINIFALGITNFLAARVLQTHNELNTPPGFGPIPIPILSEIPIIGPIVFQNNIFVYLLFAVVFVLQVALFRTRWGLRVRSVGEHPLAADTVGINVLRTRYVNVILGGMVAGLGGAFFTLGATGRFDQNMTSGRGFIGLAAMIFGGWVPVGAFGASLIFGFTDSLQSRLAILSVPIPSEFLVMLPYVVTIIIVAGLVGRVRAPAADGKPYIKE